MGKVQKSAEKCVKKSKKSKKSVDIGVNVRYNRESSSKSPLRPLPIVKKARNYN